MANAVTTVAARQKMMLARAGEAELPVIVGMAFGDGGIGPDGEVIPPEEGQTELNHELLRKPIEGHEVLSETSCRYTCTLGESELAGESISEIALYDTDGDLVGIKNFTAKGKDDDIEMSFHIDDEF